MIYACRLIVIMLAARLIIWLAPSDDVGIAWSLAVRNALAVQKANRASAKARG